jgi:hypothetical protein
MYLVGNQHFSDIIEAIRYCKRRPHTKCVDDAGTVLMEHIAIPLEMENDIKIAKIILGIQLNHEEYTEYTECDL